MSLLALAAKGGIPAEDVSVLLEITWRKIRDRWALRDGVTHANASLRVS